jgi:bifunctional non-homologous end joining protein LigD
VAAEVRKATLTSVVPKAGAGIRFNEHIEAEGPTVFAHACKMGLERNVSKRKDSPYRSGLSRSARVDHSMLKHAQTEQ